MAYTIRGWIKNDDGKIERAIFGGFGDFEEVLQFLMESADNWQELHIYKEIK